MRGLPGMWGPVQLYVLASAVLAAIAALLAAGSDHIASADVFSDGFESGNFSAWSSVTVEGDGTAVVQSGIVRSGARAARLRATANGGSRAFIRKDFQPSGGEVLSAGAFNIQSEGASGGNVPFFRLYDGAGNRLVSLYRQNGSGGLWLKHSEVYYSTGQSIGLGAWNDVQLRSVPGNPGAGIVEVWLNGAKVYSTSSATIGSAPITSVQLGNDTSSQAFDIVADNVTIATGATQPTPTPTSPGPTPTPNITPTVTAPPTPTSIVTPSPTPPRTRTPTPRPPTASPTPSPTPVTFSFGVNGDFGANSNTSGVFNRAASSGLNFFVALGDFSYNEVTPETAWCNFVKSRMGSNFPFELVAGNHEDDGPHGLVSNYKNCLPDRIGGLVGTYPKQYYFDYPKTNPSARLIFISADLTFPGEGKYSYSAGSSRYNWVASAIDQARASGIKWVIVGTHKFCIAFASSSDCQIGPDIMNLLISKKVDLYLQAHDHLYYRSKQLAHRSGCSQLNPGSYNSNCVVDTGSDGQYPKGAGTVILTTGSGGRGISGVNTSDPEAGYFTRWTASNANPTYGFMKLTITSTQISGEYVRSSGGTFTDTFTIR
jgi:hypothetical protein